MALDLTFKIARHNFVAILSAVLEKKNDVESWFFWGFFVFVIFRIFPSFPLQVTDRCDSRMWHPIVERLAELPFLYFLVHLSRRLKCTIVKSWSRIVHCPSVVVNFLHFRLLLRNRWTEFNKTWQKARSQRPLPSLGFTDQSEKEDGRPGVWFAETFLYARLQTGRIMVWWCPSVRPGLRPSVRPSVTVFRTFLLHALTYFSEILCITLFLCT